MYIDTCWHKCGRSETAITKVSKTFISGSSPDARANCREMALIGHFLFVLWTILVFHAILTRYECFLRSYE